MPNHPTLVTPRYDTEGVLPKGTHFLGHYFRYDLYLVPCDMGGPYFKAWTEDGPLCYKGLNMYVAEALALPQQTEENEVFWVALERARGAGLIEKKPVRSLREAWAKFRKGDGVSDEDLHEMLAQATRVRGFIDDQGPLYGLVARDVRLLCADLYEILANRVQLKARQATTK